ncbi:MAG: Spy/CpxP family protein refolding chaperone [Gammaproteobacteria bacterium]|nr:Spy/CpxP family protein refolding chaperone [Gammaproteobacteria bacterium]
MIGRTAIASAAIALAGMLALSQSLSAQGRFHDGTGFFGSSFHTARIARKLDLNDEQRRKFREILAAARPEADELADAILANRHALRELRKGTEMTEDEIRDIAELRGELVTKMIMLKARVRSQINALLTPDQRERFQHMQKRGMRKDGRRRHQEDRFKRS